MSGIDQKLKLSVKNVEKKLLRKNSRSGRKDGLVIINVRPVNMVGIGDHADDRGNQVGHGQSIIKFKQHNARPAKLAFYHTK